MSNCLDPHRRETYARAAFDFAHAQGLDVKFGRNKFGFTLARWRKADRDYHDFPGFYVYCSSDDKAHTGPHEDFICFDSPHKWPFQGDPSALNLALAGSFWRRDENYVVYFLNRSGARMGAVTFRDEVGERIVEVFRALEATEEWTGA